MENNIRSRFYELTAFLKEKAAAHGVAPENFEAETSSFTLAPGGHGLTEQGWHFCDLRYTGAVLIERVERATAIVLLLHARAWMDDHDDTRREYNLPEPEAAIVPLDAGTLVDLTVTAEFVDPVFLSEEEKGELAWNGRTFAPIAYDLWIAEKGEVNGAKFGGEDGRGA